MALTLVFSQPRCVAVAVEAAVSEMTVAPGCVVDETEQAASNADARLNGVRRLLVALGNALANRFPEDDLEAQFEQQVRQMLDLRSVRLREVRARYQARLVTPTRTNDSIVLGVPGSDPRVQAVPTEAGALT